MRFLSVIAKLCLFSSSSALLDNLSGPSIPAIMFEPQFRQQSRYTRIRVQNQDDINRLFPLIVDYIREPALASSVEEFVFRCYLPYRPYIRDKNRHDNLTSLENARDISQEHEILQVLIDLGLEEPERSEWARALTWMKPELVATREQTLSDDTRAADELFNWYRDRVFAHYASALLLLLCPNVKTIRYEDGSRVVEDILRRNNYGLLPKAHLQNLQEVVLLPTSHSVFEDTRYYVHLDILRSLRMFHRLPLIESVMTDGVGPNYDASFLYDFPPATSNLKKIHVGHSMYGEDTVSSLIGIPARLEELTLTTGGRCTTDGSRSFIAAKQIGKALFAHKAWLRKIDIDLDDYIDTSGYSWEDDEDEDEIEEDVDEWYLLDKEISTTPLVEEDAWKYGETIGSMHDFESLTHLSIGIRSLLGGNPRSRQSYDAPFRLAEALPKSLEYLLIRGYERGSVKEYDSQIDELLLAQETHLPALKEVHGIHELIPSAVTVVRLEDEFWVREAVDEDWVEEMS
ncbi:hypothetical protein NPX13_g8282 [Xylaria arbuscula]|uniref:Uncharacterized protein n=1 Tax=Xylaria arbuscula TaxID=114810 RepID=A0A9W8TKB4_9PEZI|nr:hypothetical protein NPX13_g8282 [Xylaria arbuscula]